MDKDNKYESDWFYFMLQPVAGLVDKINAIDQCIHRHLQNTSVRVTSFCLQQLPSPSCRDLECGSRAVSPSVNVSENWCVEFHCSQCMA